MMERDLRAVRHWEPDGHICGVAAAIIGSAVIGAGASVYGAHQQGQSAEKAAEVQQHMYDQTRADLLPYNTAGQTSLNSLMGHMGEWTTPVGLPTMPDNVALPDMPQRMTQAYLESTPGYQFTKTQGLKAVQNSAAARGLGVSGAALKGAANFATGLADNTYQHQFANEQALFGNRQTRFSDAFGQNQQQFANRQQLFNDQWTNRINPYNMLMGVSGLGENAAAQTGNVGAQTANGVSNALIQQGNAYAGGAAGVAGSAQNAAMMYAMMNGGYFG